jgi:endogenous inhibitor of DNA gyrase (YacG/DUF329 family)
VSPSVEDFERNVRAAAASDRCVCGHAFRRHDVPGMGGECIAEGCRCVEFRPVERGVATRAPAPPQPTPVSIEQLLRVAKQLGDKRERLVAERIEHLVAELRALFAADREKAAAEAAAAQIKELPKPAAAGRKYAPQEPRNCPECGKTCANGQGLAAHRRNAHQPVVTVECPECGKPCRDSGIGAHRRLVHSVTVDAPLEVAS